MIRFFENIFNTLPALGQGQRRARDTSGVGEGPPDHGSFGIACVLCVFLNLEQLGQLSQLILQVPHMKRCKGDNMIEFLRSVANLGTVSRLKH